MTIFQTPNGSPLNQAGGFQGTAPGFNVPLQLLNPPVGMLPPNADTRSGDSVMAAVSRGSAPANVVITNALVGLAPGLNPSNGRALLETQAAGGARGTAGNVGGFATGNLSMPGSGLPGGDGGSSNIGNTIGSSNQLATTTPASSITTAANPNFQG